MPTYMWEDAPVASLRAGQTVRYRSKEDLVLEVKETSNGFDVKLQRAGAVSFGNGDTIVVRRRLQTRRKTYDMT